MALWAALLIATAWAVWRRRPVGFPAALWFFSLSTSSSIVALPDLAFEHRFYLAGACTATLIVAPLARLARRVPLPLYAGAACAAAILGVLTAQRCTLFQSEWAVWSEAIERNPEQRRALSNAGGMLLERGRPGEALRYFRRIEALGIPYRMQTKINYKIGNALLDLGRYAEAREYYRRALETVEGDPGFIYMNLGHAHLREEQFAEARSMFDRALATLHGPAGLYFDLAYACARLGDANASIEAYERGMGLGGKPQPALARLVAQLRPDAATE
jgi:tetratricopeptide (TPR) repeat protein